MRDFNAHIALAEARMRAPLAYGRHDCVLFAADSASAQTGRDFRSDIRALVGGRLWRSRAQADAMLAELGGLAKAADRLLKRVARAKAHRGDIGLVMAEHGPTLVVIEGDLVAAPGADGGVARWPRTALLRAWSLG